MDDIDVHEIGKQIEAERALRPKEWTQRCELCCFWQADRRREEILDEDQTGECHRHAPRIVHVHTARGIGLIAWAVEEMAHVEHNEDFDYRFESKDSAWCDWPRTAARDWCGDFTERKVHRDARITKREYDDALDNIRQATIERCAQEVDNFSTLPTEHWMVLKRQIAAAIRALAK